MIRFIRALSCKFRWRISLIAAVGILRVSMGLLFVAVSKRAIDIAAGQTAGDITACVAGLILIIIAELIFSSVGSRTMDITDADMKNNLQERFFSHLMTSSWFGQEKMHSGDMLSRLTDDCRVVSECLCRTLPSVIIAVFQLAGAFIFLWYFSHALAITLILLLPFFILAGKIFFRKVRVLTRRVRDIESGIHAKMQESLQFRILFLTYRYTRNIIDSVMTLHRERLAEIRKRTDITVFSRTIMSAGFECGYLIAFIWGLVGLENGTVSFGLLTAYLQLAGRIQRPIYDLAGLFPGLIQSHPSFTRLADLEEMSEFVETFGDFPEGEISPAGIEFSNVTFSYPDNGRRIIKNFSHTFMPGSFTAVLGETGAGKTTLLRLILGLLKPQEGEIRMFQGNTCSTRDNGLSHPQACSVVYVPQGNTLLSGNIRSNLMIGKPDASDEEMYAALHDAAADFVENLSSGLDTVCGEHGEGLSEGQAQRIAIARGLLRPGSVLLLDEISASLDEDTERTLLSRLSSKRGKHTVIFVTHRSAVLSYCDETVRLG